jgi:hypothetical protein
VFSLYDPYTKMVSALVNVKLLYGIRPFIQPYKAKIMANPLTTDETITVIE